MKKTIHCRLPDLIFESLKKDAKQKKRTVTETVIEALTIYLFQSKDFNNV